MPLEMQNVQTKGCFYLRDNEYKDLIEMLLGSLINSNYDS